MRRLLYVIVGSSLAVLLIFTGVGCSSNPMMSETTVPVDQEPDTDVISNFTPAKDPGGRPADPTTTIDKYESDASAPQSVSFP